MQPLSRRQWLLGCGAALVTQIRPARAFNRQRAHRVVEIDSGKVRGVSGRGCVSFKGIPYAAPVSAKKRFQAPSAPRPWTGIRDAFELGSRAIQFDWPPTANDAKAKPNFFDMGTALTPMAEDCLVLNVWTPESFRPGQKLPVMVWLHGGGFFSGTAGERWTDGSRFASDEEVVLVSLNHRLNVFGFLALDEVGDERFKHSGNAGMLDIVRALVWVRDNIEAFGGDPRNVTIFGESGGAQKVITLTAMPTARNLFHRAIVQSGALRKATTLENAHALTHQILAMLDCVGRVENLLEVPANQLFNAFDTVTQRAAAGSWEGARKWAGSMFVPVVDFVSVVQDPFEQAQHAASVPLVIGTNADEYALWAQYSNTTEDNVIERIGDLGVADPVSTYKYFAERYLKESPAEILGRIGTWVAFDLPSARLADKRAEQRLSSTFMYRFSAGASWEGGPCKAYHTVEVPFVFGNVVAREGQLSLGLDVYGQPLSNVMRKSWATFARRGNPCIKGLPVWPEYVAGSQKCLTFDVNKSVGYFDLRQDFP